MPSFRRVRALLCAASVAAAGCHDLQAAPGGAGIVVRVPAITLPEATGPHRVGRSEYLWTDQTRDRTLPVWLYYPMESRDTSWEPILRDSGWAAIHQDELAVEYGPGAAARLASLHTAARSDVALGAPGPRFPVLLFAPGLGALPTDYSALIEELVSHGFVVVAFAPPGDGGTVRYVDGTTIAAGDPSCARVADDITFLRRRLLALDHDATWRFARRLDLAHVAVFGHGTGGSAALLAAAQDTGLAAAASLDGDFIGAAARGDFVHPVLYLSTEPPGLDSVPPSRWASVDRAERRREEIWQEVTATSRRAIHAQVVGMYRGNFVDAAMLPPSALPPVLRQTRVGSIDPRRGFVLAGAVVGEFFNDVFAGTRGGMEMVLARFPEIDLGR